MVLDENTRHQFENEEWMLIVGLRAPGLLNEPYIQLWKQPYGEQSVFCLQADGVGLGLGDATQVPEEAWHTIHRVRRMFKKSRGAGVVYPNLPCEVACLIAQKFGFTLEKDIYRIFAD